MKRTIRAALLALALVLGLTLPAAAAPALNTNATCSLTVHHALAEDPLEGAEVRIYYAASLDTQGNAALAGDFAAYQVSLQNLDADGWNAAAATLALYAERDGLTAAASGTTNSDGNAAFTGLSTGLYLVQVGDLRGADTVCRTAPFLVALPGLEANAWVYDRTVTTKVEESPILPGVTSVTVLKVWNDSGSSRRPESIRVTLLQNGADYETVTLSAANNWRYTWDNLSDRDVWSVVEEDVPAGYTVAYTGSDGRLVITNTYRPPNRPDRPTPPSGDDTPSEDLPDSPLPEEELPEAEPPETPGETLPEETVPQAGGHLPQTGLLWWPVPLLAIGGMALFAMGWWKRLTGRDRG